MTLSHDIVVQQLWRLRKKGAPPHVIALADEYYRKGNGTVVARIGDSWVISTKAGHGIYQARLRAFHACGDANKRPCSVCHNYDRPRNMVPRGSYALAHYQCLLEYTRRYYQTYQRPIKKWRRGTEKARGFHGPRP